MRQVRSSVFETNSSSTHCICIMSDRKEKLESPEKLYFRCDDFGSDMMELRSAEDKAAYLYASILSLCDKEKAEEAKSRIWAELGKEGIQCEFEEADYHGIYCYNASVDHAGEDDHLKFVSDVLRNRKRLLRYLFSEKSFVLTTYDTSPGEGYLEKSNVAYRHELYHKGN